MGFPANKKAGAFVMSQALVIRGTVRELDPKGVQEWETSEGQQRALGFVLVQEDAPVKPDEKWMVLYEARGEAIEQIQQSVGKLVGLRGFLTAAISGKGNAFAKVRITSVLKA